MRNIFCIGVAALSVSGCSSLLSPAGLPSTPGEIAASYGYIPLDALPIDQIGDADSCRTAPTSAQVAAGDKGDRKLVSVPVLNALPDLTIRFAVASLDTGGGLSFGPSKVTEKGKAYRAVLDYVNADGVTVDFYVRRRVAKSLDDGSLSATETIPINETVVRGYKSVGYDVQISPRFLAELQSKTEAELQRKTEARLTPEVIDSTQMQINMLEKAGYRAITVPIYVGVGLRLSADVRALEGDVNLAGLGVIGAQAEAKKLSGTLTVQTLGVNGKSVAMALPLPNKLDQTTVETAILAIGSMRAILYSDVPAANDENPATGAVATPRVVGLYSPIGSDPALINGMYSELSRIRPKWRRPCMWITTIAKK